MKVGEFRSDNNSDSEIDIVVRYPVEERSLSALDAITVPTPDGAVPISGFVTRSAQPKVNQIDRVDGERVMTVRADVAPGVLGQRQGAGVERLAGGAPTLTEGILQLQG